MLKSTTDRLLCSKQVASKLDISHRTLWRWIATHPTFPKPYRQGQRWLRWRESEIEAWLETLR